MEPYLAQVMMFGGNFAPRQWALCDGQILPINQNQALYSLLGTTYGGDGRTSFALPDMRGRSPIHAGTGPGLSARRLGNRSGVERTTLTAQNLPSHSHTASATLHAENKAGESGNPTGRLLARAGRTPIYTAYDAGADRIMNDESVVVTLSPTGGSQPVEIMNPYTVVNFIICIQGLFPSRN